jgi:hypothetical protein
MYLMMLGLLLGCVHGASADELRHTHEAQPEESAGLAYGRRLRGSSVVHLGAIAAQSDVHVEHAQGLFFNDGKAHDRSVQGLLRVKNAQLRQRLFRVQNLIEQSGKSELGTRSFAALDQQLQRNEQTLKSMAHPVTHYDQLAQIGKSQGKLYNALLQLEVESVSVCGV